MKGSNRAQNVVDWLIANWMLIPVLGLLVVVIWLVVKILKPSKSLVVIPGRVGVLDSSQASIYAEQLYSAMRRPGTDEYMLDLVYNALLKYPVGAVVDVYSAFGLRGYHRTLGVSFPKWTGVDAISLWGWLSFELGEGFASKEDKERLRKWQELFSKAGII